MFRKDLLIRLLAASLAVSLIAAPAVSFATETEKTAEEVKEGNEENEKKEENSKNASTGVTAEEVAPAEEPKPEENPEAKPESEPSSPDGSMAEALNRQRTMVADDDIMMIRIGYEFDDGSFDEWMRGAGFVVGSRYIITRQILADLSTQNSLYARILNNRGESYRRIGTNLQNEKETQEHMKCYVTDIDGRDVAIRGITVKNGLALLETSNVMDMPAVVFADPQKADLGEGKIVNAKSVGDAPDKCVVNTFQGRIVIKEGQGSGFSFIPEGESANAVGAPVYDKRGHILGMVSGDSDGMSCFSINSLQTFLTTNGVKFRAIEQIEAEDKARDQENSESDIQEAEEVVADKSGLEAAIDRARAVEEKDYTPESYAEMKSALEEAVRVDADLEATQEQVDEATGALNGKLDALEYAGFFKKLVNREGFPIILGVILAVIAAGIVAFVKLGLPKAGGRASWKKAGRSAKEKKTAIQEEENDDLPGPYTEPWEDDEDDMDITRRPKGKAKRRPDDYDPGIEYAEEEESSDLLDDNDGSGDTMLLKKEAYLIREENGKVIPIKKNNFMIGKERKKVDYCISGDETVSRHHCTIRTMGGKYYIEDNDSSNYTRVNGKRLRPYANAHIEDGDRIRISEIDFIFHTK